MVKCNNNNNTLKANPDDNTLKANPALCKHSTTTTIKTTAQIMHKSDNNNNNNKDTSKMQYFAAMHDCSCLFLKVEPFRKSVRFFVTYQKQGHV